MGKKRQPLPKSLANDPVILGQATGSLARRLLPIWPPQAARKLLQNCDAPNQIVAPEMHGLTSATPLNQIEGTARTRSGCSSEKVSTGEKA
jgi:hypothetical protein